MKYNEIKVGHTYAVDFKGQNLGVSSWVNIHEAKVLAKDRPLWWGSKESFKGINVEFTIYHENGTTTTENKTLRAWAFKSDWATELQANPRKWERVHDDYEKGKEDQLRVDVVTERLNNLLYLESSEDKDDSPVTFVSYLSRVEARMNIEILESILDELEAREKMLDTMMST